MGLSLIAVFGVCRCGAEPRGAPPRRSDPDVGPFVAAPRPLRGPAVAGGVRLPPRGAPVVRPSPPVAGPGRVAFALDSDDDVAAFDADSGAVLGRYAYGGMVTDLCWDRWRKRVVFAQTDGYVDGSRVYALEWDSGFVPRASSPGIVGTVRLACTQAGVVAISDDHGIESWWTLLDAELMPVGDSAPLPVVASALPSASHWIVGFARNVWAGGALRDALVAVDGPGGAWTTLRAVYPADGADGLRLAAGAGPDAAWLVRRPRQSGTVRLAAVDLAHPAAAAFHDAARVLAAGELEDVVYEPTQHALVLLADSDAGATLDVVPTGPGGSATHRQLPAHAKKADTVLHALVVDPPTGRVLVATAGGIFALSPSGTSSAPALAPVPSFAAAGLRAPVVIP